MALSFGLPCPFCQQCALWGEMKNQAEHAVKGSPNVTRAREKQAGPKQVPLGFLFLLTMRCFFPQKALVRPSLHSALVSRCSPDQQQMDPATTQQPGSQTRSHFHTTLWSPHWREDEKTKSLQPWQFTPMLLSYQNPDHKQEHMANTEQRTSNVQQMATMGS